MYVYIINTVFKIILPLNINKHVSEWSISFPSNPTEPEENVHVPPPPPYYIFTSENTPLSLTQSVFRSVATIT